MIQRYVPTELYYQGETYPVGTQEIPQGLYDYIESDPQLSKVKEPKQVDGLAYLKTCSLEELERLLTEEFQQPIERLSHTLNIASKMGQSASEMRNRIINLDNLKSEYNRVLTYLKPVIAAKQAEQARIKQSLERWAKGFNAQVSFTSSGYPALHVPKQSVMISRGTP